MYFYFGAMTPRGGSSLTRFHFVTVRWWKLVWRTIAETLAPPACNALIRSEMFAGRAPRPVETSRSGRVVVATQWIEAGDHVVMAAKRIEVVGCCSC